MINTEVIFLANNKPIHIAEKEMRRLLFRILNRTNAARRLGAFSVYPATGLVRFRHTCMVEQAQLSSPSQFKRLTDETREHLFPLLEISLMKILELSGLGNHIIDGCAEKESRVHQEELKRLNMIRKCVQISAVRFPREAVVENHVSLSKTNNQQESDINVADPAFNDMKPYFESFQKYFSQASISTSIQAQPTNIYSNIEIKNPDRVEWQPLKQTKMSVIERAKVTYVYSKNIMREFTKVLVRKTELENVNKLKRQQELLQSIRESVSPNFIRTFTDGSLALYTEMSPTGTYNAYIKQNNECLSLFTKLYSLSQILQGMRFLQENKITHMDLKPQNILIGRNLNMKLNDLGEAYHSEHLVNYQPGYSIPYSPPEVHQFTNNSNTTINSKSDVYSFGVILMWNLFSSQPLNVRPSVVDSVIKEMIDGTYANRLIATPISNNQFGPQSLMETLYSLGLQCFDPDPNKRPQIDWMIVVMRESLAHLQKLY